MVSKDKSFFSTSPVDVVVSHWTDQVSDGHEDSVNPLIPTPSLTTVLSSQMKQNFWTHS